MRLAGIDFAWHCENNPSSIAIGNLSSNTLSVEKIEPSVIGLNKIVEIIANQTALSGLAIDAPLIINNESGQRECEKALSRDYGSRKASCHTSNKKLYPDALSVSLSRSLKSFGYDHLSKNKWMLECYPHPAIIECFGLTERHLYKKGNVADKKLGQIELANMISKLAFSNVLALKIPIEMEFYLSESYIKNLKGKALKSNEDVLDAIVCLYISGLYAKNASSTTYGTSENGYIWVPQIKCI